MFEVSRIVRAQSSLSFEIAFGIRAPFRRLLYVECVGESIGVIFWGIVYGAFPFLWEGDGDGVGMLSFSFFWIGRYRRVCKRDSDCDCFPAWL